MFNERIADVAERYLRKGRKVYVEASLQTRKWTDQSGQEKHATEVVIEVVIERFRGELVLLDSGRDEGGATSRSDGAGTATGRHVPASVTPLGGDLDDEIAF